VTIGSGPIIKLNHSQPLHRCHGVLLDSLENFNTIFQT
jgi:hypothetical protein